MNATPKQLAQKRRGAVHQMLHNLKVGAVRTLLSDVDLSKEHLNFKMRFGQHSVAIGDLVRITGTPSPSQTGDISVDSNGRLQVYVSSAAKTVPHADEVLALSGGTLTGDIDLGGNKITGGGAPTAGSDDLVTQSAMETYIAGMIGAPVDVGYPNGGLVGKGTVSGVNGQTPAAGWCVVFTDSGTPTAGTSDAMSAGDVGEFDGESWKKIVANSGGYVPSGTRIPVSTAGTIIPSSGITTSQDEGKIAVFGGSSNNPSSFKTPTDGQYIVVKGEGALHENKGLVFDGSVPTGQWKQPAAASTAHSDLSGLTSGDDHTQYAKLTGRSGGQTVKGGTASGEHLILESTSNATKGDVRVASGTDIRMMGNDTFVPDTSGQGSLGTSGNKFGSVYTTNLYTGDLHMANPDGDPEKSWTLVEDKTSLRALNRGTGKIHRVHMVREGSIADRLLRLLG